MSYLATVNGRELARELYRIGAVLFGNSNCPLLFNLRTPQNFHPGPLTPFLCKAIACAFAQTLHDSDIRFDGVCGIPNSGEPFADGMNHSVVSVPIVRLVKPLPCDETRCNTSVGSVDELLPSATILLVDNSNLETDAKLVAIKTLRDYGFSVHDLMVVVDHEREGVDPLRQEGVRTHSLFSLRKLVQHYFYCGLIDGVTLDRATAYLTSR